MRNGRVLYVAVLMVISTTCSSEDALAQDVVQAQEVSGGTIRTDLGYGIVVNKGSMLDRKWIVLNSGSCPAQIEAAGVKTTYDSDDRAYKYIPHGTLVTIAPLSAFEIRFLLYDVWGEHLKTLSGTEITEISPSESYPLKNAGVWRAWENEISEYLVCVAYIARVRTADGKVWTADTKKTLDALATSSLSIRPEELNPTVDEK